MKGKGYKIVVSGCWYYSFQIVLSSEISNMKKYFIFQAFVFILCVFASTQSAAQATRTWISGVGDDVNPCSRTAPCKTFAGAISKTAAGGEINILDPGGFGAVTITKSITLDGGGTFASILSSGTNGIIINSPDVVVTLRHLSINGSGTGITGIKVLAAQKVQIEDCYLGNFTQKGIEVLTTVPCAVVINNTTIHNAEDAIAITNTAGNVMISGSKIQTVKNAGINLLGGEATISNSDISDCKTGIVVQAGNTINLSNDVISNNQTALQGPGKINSAGNNFFAGNKTQGATVSVVKLQ